MNKPILDAIDRKLPMRWEIDYSRGSFCLMLLARTYTYESGAERTRMLWLTYDARNAHYVHGEILRQGGKVTEPTPKALYEKWQEQE